MQEIDFKYQTLPKQAKFIDSQKRFTGYVGGIGSGKTHIGCIKTIQIMLNFPKTVGVIVAPTYPMLRDATQRTFMEIIPRELIREHMRVENKIMLHNGSEVLFRSADDPERLRGPNLDWFWIDEASMCPSMTWKIMIGRIRKGILDVGFVTGTPKGFNWVYREFVEKQRDNYFIIQCSSRENSFLTNDFIESLEENYSGTFARQEIEGEFTNFEGQVYDNFSFEVHLIKEPDIHFSEIIAGLDYGFTNPTGSLIIGLDGDKRAYILDEYYRTKQDIENTGNWLLGKKEIYDFIIIYADPSEPMMTNKLQSMGLNVQNADNKVMPGINFIHSLFEVQKDGKPKIFIVSKNCPNFVKEINYYRYADRKEDKQVKEEPIKVDDHLMDALRYALFSHLRARGDFTVLEGEGMF